MVASGQYLMALLMVAYDVSPLQISGVPSVFFEKKYDIEATCEEPMTKEQLPHLLRSLLEERFHLSIHREQKEQPVYALIVGKSGSRLQETTHESEKPNFRQAGHSFTFTNATTENLLSVLSQVAGRKVLDKTGLSGHYDFTLSYTPDAAATDRIAFLIPCSPLSESSSVWISNLNAVRLNSLYLTISSRLARIRVGGITAPGLMTIHKGRLSPYSTSC